MEGLLQTITVLDVQPDLLPQGLIRGELLIPKVPLIEPSSERLGTTALVS